jgi:nicotinic acid mononucleotide adenylyltransferase/tRNA A-37 threonylcarbamoyl transferase component Bud32
MSSPTPLDKLHPPTSGLRPVLLVFNGTFCPVHVNHLRMLTLARAWAEQRLGWSVVGGYLMVTHDSSCQRKLDKEFCPAQHRLGMCQAATADSDWIMVDPYPASQPGNPGAQASLLRLEGLVSEHLGVPVAALPVCGGDLLPMLKRAYLRGVICVVNRTLDFDLDAYLASAAVGPHRAKIVVVRDSEVAPLSSTRVRALVRSGGDLTGVLPAAVIRYHQDHGITYDQPPPEDATPAPADVLPEWAREEPFAGPLVEIGRGVQAVVYGGRWQGMEVAVKVWPLDGLNSKERRRPLEAAERESRLLRALDHENVIRCHAGRVENDRAYLILERATGPLWQLRQADGVLPCFPDARWLSVLRDLARAMVHLAERGIVHRDLLVQNLLYTAGADGTCTVKLSDFGVAKWLADAKEVARGALRHYPPEAINKVGRGYYTEKADVFLFGYVLHDLAHGEITWTRENTQEAIAQTLAGDRPALRVPCLPELASLRAWCWRHAPAERPTFREVLERLEQMRPA